VAFAGQCRALRPLYGAAGVGKDPTTRKGSREELTGFVSEISPQEKMALRHLLRLREEGTSCYRLKRPDALLVAVFEALQRRGMITMEVAGRIILPDEDASVDYDVRLTPTGLDAARQVEYETWEPY